MRRAESKQRPELKRNRYLWLKNKPNLSAEQAAQLGSLANTNLRTARAYRLRGDHGGRRAAERGGPATHTKHLLLRAALARAGQGSDRAACNGVSP